MSTACYLVLHSWTGIHIASLSLWPPSNFSGLVSILLSEGLVPLSPCMGGQSPPPPPPQCQHYLWKPVRGFSPSNLSWYSLFSFITIYNGIFVRLFNICLPTSLRTTRTKTICYYCKSRRSIVLGSQWVLNQYLLNKLMFLGTLSTGWAPQSRKSNWICWDEKSKLHQ